MRRPRAPRSTRIADRQVEMWNTADEFIAGTEAGRQRTWYQLRVDQLRAAQVTANGVNLTVSFSRLTRDGIVMSKDDGVVSGDSARWGSGKFRRDRCLEPERYSCRAAPESVSNSIALSSLARFS